MRTLIRSTLGAIVLTASALSATIATTSPAAARVSFGIGLGVPGPVYYGRPYYSDPCASPRFRYYHPGYCYYPGYYDSGYYEPGWVDGIWITDSFGNRHWQSGHWRGGSHRR